jgi:hypothetical protein
MRRAYLPALLILLALAGSGSARTWYITEDGTGDAATIQAGIDSSAAADTVLLANGTYTGNGNRDLDFLGKAVTVMSESNDPSRCTVDCQGSTENPHRAFSLHSGEGPGSTIRGITVENGYRLTGGGAVYCHGSSPTIDNVVFRANHAGNAGGAVECIESSSPRFMNVVFLNNSADGGGAIRCVGPSSPVFEGVTFQGNTAGMGGAGSFENSDPQFEACIFTENTATSWGGALSIQLSETSEISNTLFAGNSSGGDGGVLHCLGSQVTITDATIYGSAAPYGGAVSCIYTSWVYMDRVIIAFGTQGEPVDGVYAQLSCCDVYGNTDGDWVGPIASQSGLRGNFSEDPLFCNPGLGDFWLEQGSPCLPGLHPTDYDCGGVVGAYDMGCGWGGAEPSTWGTIKAMYR